MLVTASKRDSNSRPGHLDTTWEIAVVSCCIVIFVAASVVIYLVRRRERLRRLNQQQEVGRPRSRKRGAEDAEKVNDLERGEKHTSVSHDDQDADYTDVEDEEQTVSSKSKSKATRPKKHMSPTRTSDNTKSETGSFSHSCKKPPKSYCNHR